MSEERAGRSHVEAAEVGLMSARVIEGPWLTPGYTPPVAYHPELGPEPEDYDPSAFAEFARDYVDALFGKAEPIKLHKEA